MKMLPVVNSLDNVPEPLREAYVQAADGKYHLDLDGLPPNAVDKGKLDEFRNNNVALLKQLEDFKAKYGDVDMEEYNRIKEEQRKLKDKELIDAGKIDELLAQRTEAMRRDFEAQRTKLLDNSTAYQTQAEKANQRLSEVLVETEVMKNVGSVGVLRSGANFDVLQRAKSVWSVQDGQLRAMEGDTPIYGKDGKNPLTVTEWCQGLAETAPYLFESSQGSGSKGGKPNNGGPSMKYISRSDPNYGKSLEKIASGELEVRD
jgi:hypothetical protein